MGNLESKSDNMGLWKKISELFGSTPAQSSPIPTTHTPSRPRRAMPSTLQENKGKCATESCQSDVHMLGHTYCHSCWWSRNVSWLGSRQGVDFSSKNMYEHIIDIVSIGSDKEALELSEQDFRAILCGQHSFREIDVESILSSSNTRGILGWETDYDSTSNNNENVVSEPESSTATDAQEDDDDLNTMNLADQWRESIGN